MEVWGGIECTINRVGDDWFNQLQLSGHAVRSDDLELIAQLGIRTLRYPILWEATAPDAAGVFDWRWADQRLRKLRELSIAPIVGLVHHGSGPRYTSLLDDTFASGLAAFAGRVAERFPWIDRFTPVNEPLTTARFSGLYGLWHPHGRSDQCFARAFMNQCRATVLAMQAVRRCNPAARLVQTEDLGTTYSTPYLRYQADFENDRRWLTWDLLCGRVGPDHALFPFLLRSGIPRQELDWFIENSCPPEIIGINHYVTSDRFLDDRITRYAEERIGGNHQDRYVDVEAVRVLSGDYDGFAVLGEAYRRYGLPVALTEVHLGCTREEQLRWLQGAWRAANTAAEAGCDVRAVTSWALFGAFNWDTLLTRQGSYEPGAFDVRSPRPRPTAIARLIRELAAGAEGKAIVSDGPGWWDRPERLFSVDSAKERRHARHLPDTKAAPLLICGGGGSLGRALAAACLERGLACRSVMRSELDICDRASVSRLVRELEPWAIVNAAGFTRVDDAQRQPAECFRQNVTGAALLMELARERDIPLVTFSSDMVFDGVRRSAYVESSRTSPLNEYGRSKEAAERRVLQYRQTLCIRTATFFGCWERGDFLSESLQALAQGRRIGAASDVVMSPCYLPDLAGACLDLLLDGERGVFHVTNDGCVSWFDFTRAAAEVLGVASDALQPRRLDDMHWTAQRPLFSALRSERASLMPGLESALRRYAVTACRVPSWRGGERKAGNGTR